MGLGLDAGSVLLQVLPLLIIVAIMGYLLARTVVVAMSMPGRMEEMSERLARLESEIEQLRTTASGETGNPPE